MSEVLLQEQQLEEFFGGRIEARTLFDALRADIEALGPVEMRVTKSQIALATDRNVAVVWIPDRYLDPKRSAPLVLTLSFRRRDTSPRWKQIVSVGGGRYTHHLELRSADEIDDDLRGWLAEARALTEARP